MHHICSIPAPRSSSAELCSTLASAAVISAARRRAAREGDGYAWGNAPVSPLSGLTGNTLPGVSRPPWLRAQNKCNQFVGDVLHDAGFEMPTFRMPDRSLHYMHAEVLPRQRRFFESISALSAARAGDLLILDDTRRRGESTAHVEIIETLSPTQLVTMGAHRAGVRSTDRSALLPRLRLPPSGNGWSSGSSRIYILRPIRARPEGE